MSRDAIAAGGKPVTIPLLDQQSMMFELEKQKSRLEGLGGSTKFIEAICVLVSFFETGSALKDKPESLETWWKMLGPTLGVLQVTFEVAGDRNMRRGLAAGGQMAYTQAARGTQYLNIGNGLRVAGAVIGIIDGFMALAEAESMARRGELRSRVRTQAFLGGLGIGGGLLALAASSLVLIPFIIGVVMLIGAYLLVKLVPNNIATWLRRSLYGKEQETFRFQPFQSMQEEQESLKMVFSGIEFDMDVVRFGETLGGALVRTSFIEPGVPPRPLSEVENAILQNVNLTVTISFPKGLKGELKVWINLECLNGERLYLTGARYADDEVAPIDRYSRLIRSFDGRGVAGESISKPEFSTFLLELNENKGLLTYKEELGDKKGNLVATLQYAPQIGVFPEEEYIMEI